MLIRQGRLGAPVVVDLEPLTHGVGHVLEVDDPHRGRVGLRNVGDDGHCCSWARLRAKAAWTRRTCLLKTSRGGRATSGPAERRRAAYSAADITHRVAKTLTETASGSPVKESAEDVVEAVTQAPPVRKEPRPWRVVTRVGQNAGA